MQLYIIFLIRTGHRTIIKYHWELMNKQPIEPSKHHTVTTALENLSDEGHQENRKVHEPAVVTRGGAK